MGVGGRWVRDGDLSAGVSSTSTALWMIIGGCNETRRKGSMPWHSIAIAWHCKSSSSKRDIDFSIKPSNPSST